MELSRWKCQKFARVVRYTTKASCEELLELRVIEKASASMAGSSSTLDEKVAVF